MTAASDGAHPTGSAVSTRPRPAPSPANLTADDVDTASERGRTVVADRVIVRIAAQAAGEVEHTTDLSPTLVERLPGRHGATARADAVVSGRLVQLRVEVGVEYPTPIVSVTREVRRHVGDVVSRLCDVEVRDVDVVVGRLRRIRPSQARRVS